VHQGAKALFLGVADIQLQQGEGIESGEGSSRSAAVLARNLIQQSGKKYVVTHQQGGPVMALQAQGPSRCQEQAH
jgi:hypothetical protein